MHAKSVSVASSVLFDIEEDGEASMPQEEDADASPSPSTRGKAAAALKPARPGAVSSATTVQSNDDYDSARGSSAFGAFPLQPESQQQRRRRARSRKASIYATWTCCGYALSNAALRLITSTLTVPAIVAGLVVAPRVALAFLCSALVCVGAFEFAWLAFRVHHQLLATFDYYERKLSAAERRAADDGADGSEFPFASFVSGHTQSTTRSPSTGQHLSLYAQSQRESFEDPVLEDLGATTRALPTWPSPLDALFADGKAPDLLSSVAASWFGGRVLVARLALAVPLAALWSLATHALYAATTFPVAAVPHAFVEFPYVLWAANLLAAVCALAAPTGAAALALAVQKEVFVALLLNSANCPLVASECEAARPMLQPLQTFVLGLLLLLLLRSAAATSPADLAVAATLDVLGYTYVVGASGLLVAVADTRAAAGGAFVHLLLLQLLVVWTAELAGYCCDAVMYHFRVDHAQVLPSWLALKLNAEAAICEAGVGVAAMLVGAELLEVDGSAGAKVACALFAVLAGRLGRLFLALLKRAAGVRWSSRLLPGFGGLLDAATPLLFASLVFAQFFLYVGTLRYARRQDGSPHGAAAGSASVDFSTRLTG
ncbi:hypothetical protein PybrP1_004579 [[Pythium] brassicae (nom. inval.)]|nr:hypothetical protein PybrP1_004579 [[Pythium] brassicae (nom. inval.)]